MNIDFQAIEKICHANSKISSGIIDEFLIYYAAEDKKLRSKMEKLFADYRHISKDLPDSFERLCKAQYLAHRIFKENGLIGKFLHHSALKNVTGDERKLLGHYAKHPWKFSFSSIVDMPAKDFFVMYDEFRDDEFLLYSPGITKTRKEMPAKLWFNLITFNGACWQSTGPIAGYQSFEPDDIFFFFTEKNPDLAAISDERLVADVEEDPVPYMMLISGSTIPLIFNKKDEIMYHNALFPVQSFNTDELRKEFRLEYNNSIYKLSLKRWDGHPHLAVAFYDEDKEEMIFTAMTERGFDKLVMKFNELGLPFGHEPDVRVHLSMITTAQDILKREIVLNEYEELFVVEPSETETEEVEKINYFMSLVLPEINAGKKPDIEKLAIKAGLDLAVAEQLVAHILKKLEKM